jgi:hypothetical protein
VSANAVAAATAPQTLLERFDDNINGTIEIGEARAAVSAYFNDEITLLDARTVVGLYFAN